MAWVNEVRQRAEDRLVAARRSAPPPFVADANLGEASAPVVLVEAAPTIDDGLPPAVRTAGAWAWRIILFVAAAYLLIRVVALLRVVIIPVVVALLLAALFQPVAAYLRRRGMNKSLAAALVLVTALVVVFGGLSLIVQTFISQLDDLTSQVSDGIDEVQSWLASSPLHISQTQINNGVEQLQKSITSNRGALTSGALSTATTLGEVAAGFFLVLFTLFFYLRDGGQIWTFLCRLLPRSAQVPTAGAGHYAWHTLVSYVHATVLVAFVDAVGIGIGLEIMRVPLALPLAALVFIGAFIPVVGATVTGVAAILVALVTQGPISALIILGVVIAVQQLEGHVLQPLIMGRAVALHPLAVILAIATGVVVAGIVGGLVAVPLLAVLNTAIRYLVSPPEEEPLVSPPEEEPLASPPEGKPLASPPEEDLLSQPEPTDQPEREPVETRPADDGEAAEHAPEPTGRLRAAASLPPAETSPEPGSSGPATARPQ
jgi:predicted PurR-regulated permease PerM